MLLSAFEFFVETAASKDPLGTQSDAQAELLLASRSVAAILQAQGRVIYDFEPGRQAHVLRPASGEWAFAADYGKCSFPHGEFPAYDMVRERMSLIAKNGSAPTLSEEERIALERIYEDAVQAIDSGRPK